MRKAKVKKKATKKRIRGIILVEMSKLKPRIRKVARSEGITMSAFVRRATLRELHRVA